MGSTKRRANGTLSRRQFMGGADIRAEFPIKRVWTVAVQEGED